MTLEILHKETKPSLLLVTGLKTWIAIHIHCSQSAEKLCVFSGLVQATLLWTCRIAQYCWLYRVSDELSQDETKSRHPTGKVHERQLQTYEYTALLPEVDLARRVVSAQATLSGGQGDAHTFHGRIRSTYPIRSSSEWERG